VALLAERGSYGGALLLHHRALVGDGLGGAHIADELLYWMMPSTLAMFFVKDCRLPSVSDMHTGAHIGGLEDRNSSLLVHSLLCGLLLVTPSSNSAVWIELLSVGLGRRIQHTHPHETYVSWPSAGQNVHNGQR
jgi:hypothetical protein